MPIPLNPHKDPAKIVRKIAPLYGLVLAGGKSLRMGKDKSAIVYHKENQVAHQAELLNNFCEHTFVSRQSHHEEGSQYDVLTDTVIGLGPMGGLLSAFEAYPHVSWFCVACDLPFLDLPTLKLIVEARNPEKVATCFLNPVSGMPEPLVTIWEHVAYPILLDFVSQGVSSLKKVLIHSDVAHVMLDDPHKLFNANTPKDRDEALSFLRKTST